MTRRKPKPRPNPPAVKTFQTFSPMPSVDRPILVTKCSYCELNHASGVSCVAAMKAELFCFAGLVESLRADLSERTEERDVALRTVRRLKRKASAVPDVVKRCRGDALPARHKSTKC